VSRLRYSGSISLDGFAAGPDQSRENPLGVGGRALHTWVKEREDTTSRLLEDEELGVGAGNVGRGIAQGEAPIRAFRVAPLTQTRERPTWSRGRRAGLHRPGLPGYIW